MRYKGFNPVGELVVMKYPLLSRYIEPKGT